MILPKRLIIVPALNEADCIAAVIEDLLRHAPGFDVLVIDDGSTDGTASRVPPPAKVITLPFNQGIGGAVQTGYRYAAVHGYDVAVQVDGDGQHPAELVAALVDQLEKTDSDLVIGSRFLDAAAEGYRPPPSRMVGIRWLRLLIGVLTGLRVTDSTSGFRAANRRAIEAFAQWYPEDYPEPEVIVLLDRAGFRVTEMPVRMAARAGGQTSIPFARGLFYVVKVSAAVLLDVFRKPWARANRP